MQERRRHQRVRFGQSPDIVLGFQGAIARGVIENLSPVGLMVRSELPLVVGCRVGCEFSLFGSPRIDVSATVVSRLGEVFGVRFQGGLVNQIVLDDALEAALVRGLASVLAVHDIDGSKVLRVTGGLNGALREDFVHALTRGGVDRIDVSGVTAVDEDGLNLCLLAMGRYQVDVSQGSECFAKAWEQVKDQAKHAWRERAA